MVYDPIEVSQAAKKAREALEKSGSVGYVEPANILTWDGNTDGLEHDGDAYLAFAGDYDINNATSFSLFYPELNTTITTPKSDLYFSQQGDVTVVFVTETQAMLAIGVPGVGIGVVCTEDHYVSRIEFTETIHPIAPKFLPGVCLPVVELTTAATADGAALTEEEAAMLTALNGEPCVMKVNLSVEGTDARINGVADVVTIDGTVTYVLGNTVQAMLMDGSWKIGIV